ncbi:hypothetical protein ELG77_09085 [Rhizobium leguminosarum]|uniref:hypothetical protein n=1 Tax=Rhizobium leguminosarum TaxID=384 RepID=UPI0010319326|nr:hypothetical protein [Rhizobium leguminosarum]TBG41914.1 hypothetical protein ELG77_09085 [Rhizobium leguminosarum]
MADNKTTQLDETIVDLNHPVPKWLKDRFNDQARAMGGLGKTFKRLITAFVENPAILDTVQPITEMPLDTDNFEIQVPPMLRSGLIAVTTGPSVITEAMITEPDFLHLSGAELNTHGFLNQFLTVLAERIVSHRHTVISLPMIMANPGRANLQRDFFPEQQDAIRRIGEAVREVKSTHGSSMATLGGTFELWAEVQGMHHRPYFSLLTNNILVTVPDIQVAHAGLELVFRNSDNPHYSAHISAMHLVKNRHRAEWKPINYLLDEE